MMQRSLAKASGKFRCSPRSHSLALGQLPRTGPRLGAPSYIWPNAQWLLHFIFTLHQLRPPEWPGACPSPPPTLACFLTVSLPSVPAVFLFLQSHTFRLPPRFIFYFFLARISLLLSLVPDLLKIYLCLRPKAMIFCSFLPSLHLPLHL